MNCIIHSKIYFHLTLELNKNEIEMAYLYTLTNYYASPKLIMSGSHLPKTQIVPTLHIYDQDGKISLSHTSKLIRV